MGLALSRAKKHSRSDAGSSRYDGMNFQAAQAEYDRLKAQFESGELTAGEFEEQVFNLVVEDERGGLWQLGLAGGNWYRIEGDKWVAAIPPVSVRPETGEEKRPAGSAVGVVTRLTKAMRATLAGKRFGMPGWALSGLGLAALLLVATVAIMLTGGLNRQTKPIAAITPSATVDEKVSIPDDRTPTLNVIAVGETPTTITTPVRMTEVVT
ncbi:MAG: hypothetical protein U1B80_08490, partial [Anaerolineaceae bacterium]|nr:hypothetical protein [Anaerolineaceae bacterium]